MVLTPEEIKQRRFALREAGYDVAEVDEFLREVAANYEAALQAIATMHAERLAVGRSLEAIDNALSRLRAARPSLASSLRDGN